MSGLRYRWESSSKRGEWVATAAEARALGEATGRTYDSWGTAWPPKPGTFQVVCTGGLPKDGAQ